jgi:hypothetical protein
MLSQINNYQHRNITWEILDYHGSNYVQYETRILRPVSNAGSGNH